MNIEFHKDDDGLTRAKKTMKVLNFTGEGEKIKRIETVLTSIFEKYLKMDK